jgi:tetratricopeptide (TPR) repeat protein
MLLVGVNSYDAGQFQTARACFQTALEAAHEAEHNILQALAWNWDSFSWVHSNEPNRYERALDGMLKACHFASLESDLTVECNMQADLAEVYAYLKKKEACLEALKQANRVDRNALGDWYHIHHFGLSSVNGFLGRCLPQFYQPDVPDTYALLEEARQALQTALSQQNVSPLKRAVTVADMAQIHARKGEVETACNYIKQVVGIIGTSAVLRQRFWTVRTLLEPYADVRVVKDLDREIRALLLVG